MPWKVIFYITIWQITNVFWTDIAFFSMTLAKQILSREVVSRFVKCSLIMLIFPDQWNLCIMHLILSQKHICLKMIHGYLHDDVKITLCQPFDGFIFYHKSQVTSYITPPPPYFILWNAVRVKKRVHKNPPPYSIVSASSVKTKEVEVIEFHRIVIPWGPYVH